MRFCRTREWKYAYYVQGGKSQLFDLVSDPGELHDLAGHGLPAEAMMHQRMLDYYVSEGHNLQLSNGTLSA
jgi:hypothetical protein